MRKSQSPEVHSRLTAVPIPFGEACSIVAAQSAAILESREWERESCDLLDALGRRLAEPLMADRDQPPFPRVTRDGFAVRSQDLTTGAPLRVVGQLRAGEAWPAGNLPLAVGEAVEIMTGAPLPPGADAVLMVERAQEVSRNPPRNSDVELSKDRFVLPDPHQSLAPGENVVPQGGEARRGDVLLEPGLRLGPERVALAAACGLLSVRVYAKPKVAILATGDELVEPAGQQHSRRAGSGDLRVPIEPHQIYNSNSHAIASLVHGAGGIPLRRPAARDEVDDLRDSIRWGLDAAPLLLLTGGVSMGKFDLVEKVLAGIGAEFFFTGVKMQPGKPVVFGRVPARDRRPARYFFGLPGNPVSAMVTFRVFVTPLLAALAGERGWQPNVALARLGAEFQTKPGLMRFVPANLNTSHSVPIVTPLRTQGSGDLAANARSNCYLIAPEDCDRLAEGQMVKVLLR
ncbi:MAG: molybdopterin molybdotransferase MoeA [Acidobacteriaceae bacterium]